MKRRKKRSIAERLRRFDQATRRQEVRQAQRNRDGEAAAGRGWTREELYDRGRAREELLVADTLPEGD